MSKNNEPTQDELKQFLDSFPNRKIPASMKALAGIARDAKRFQFIREMKVNMTPKMDGQHHYHFNQIYAKGNTFDEAIDNEMKRIG